MKISKRRLRILFICTTFAAHLCSMQKAQTTSLYFSSQQTATDNNYSLNNMKFKSITILAAVILTVCACNKPSKADLMRQQMREKDSLQYVQALKTRNYSDSLLQTLLPEVDPLLKDFLYEKDSAYEDNGHYVHKLLRTDKNTARNYLQAYVSDDRHLTLQSYYYGAAPVNQHGIRLSFDEGFVEAEGTNHRFEVEGVHEVLTIPEADALRLLEQIALHTESRMQVRLQGTNEPVYYLQRNEKLALADTYRLAVLMSDISTLEHTIRVSDKQIEKYLSKQAARNQAKAASAPSIDDTRNRPARPRVKRPAACKPLRKSAQQTLSAGDKNIAPRGLLILANFQDVRFRDENDHDGFDSLANALNYNYQGATGSAREYFRAQSNGQYVPVFDVIGPVELPHKMAFYGTNDADGLDSNTGDFVMDAVNEADKLGVDYTLYDHNNDGFIDFVYILYAGFSEADKHIADAIWPHNWDMMSNFYYGCTTSKDYYYYSESDYKLPEYDGLWLNDYACSACLRPDETRAGIGTFSHEFGHVLGLPDYYPPQGKDYNTVLPYTPGSWSIMGYGCYINNGKTPCNYSAFDKYYLGWITPSLPAHGENIVLPADGKTAYMVTRDGNMPPDGAETADTVYYIENRQYSGWDIYLPGHGMLIWQVVYNKDDWYNNSPNNGQSLGYTLLTASGVTPYTTATGGQANEDVPFIGADGELPVVLFNRYELRNIKEQDGIISFRFIDTTQPDIETALGQTEPEQQAGKRLQDGRIYIYRSGQTYDLMGNFIR